MLQALPSRLNTLFIQAQYDGTHHIDLIVEEKGEFKAMKLDELKLLDQVLSRDNFKDLRLLVIGIFAPRDVCSPLREGTIKSIQQKLPTLYKRETLHIQLDFDYYDPDSVICKYSKSAKTNA